MKKPHIAALLALLFVLTSLSGCITIVRPAGPTVEAATPGVSPPPSAVSPTPGGVSPSQPTVTPTAPSGVKEAEGVRWNAGALCAVGFIGYGDPWWGIAPDFLPLFMVHRDLWEKHDYGTNTIQHLGEENFYILPRYADATVIIEAITTDGQVIEQVYSGGSDSVIIACNESDLYRNTLITVTGGGGSVSFSPSVSLMDGSVELPGGGGVQDITVPHNSYDEAGPALGVWDRYGVHPDMGDAMWSLEFAENGSMRYFYGWPYSEIVEDFRGTYYVVNNGNGAGKVPDGSVIFSLYLSGGIALEGETYPFYGVYELAPGDRNTLNVTHVSGDKLIYSDPDGASYLFDAGGVG